MATVIKDTIDFQRFINTPEEAADVKPASSWCDAVIARMYNEGPPIGCLLPWSKTHKDVVLRPGELSIWAGVNGHGKSMMISQIMLGAMNRGEKVCIASMEMKPVSTMLRMARQAAANSEPSIPFIRKFHSWTDNKLWLYDQQGAVKSSRMIALSRYCRSQLGITHIVIDSLMKCGIKTDDYNAQKEFINELHSLAQDTGLHVHVVAHLRKSGSEMERPDKMDVKGAGEIVDQTDNLFIVWRNKAKEEATRKGKESTDPDAMLIVGKQRHGESEPHIALWFEPDSMQYVAQPGRAIQMAEL